MNHDLDVAGTVVPALREALGDRLCAVVLFGSRARGDYAPDSDWDLLVIADELPEKPWERYQTIKGMLPPGSRGSTAVLAATPQEFDGRLPELYLDIALDGRVLYDRSYFATSRLVKLRNIMDKAGLYRTHSQAGDVWNWRTQPTEPWSISWEE